MVNSRKARKTDVFRGCAAKGKEAARRRKKTSSVTSGYMGKT